MTTGSSNVNSLPGANPATRYKEYMSKMTHPTQASNYVADAKNGNDEKQDPYTTETERRWTDFRRYQELMNRVQNGESISAEEYQFLARFGYSYQGLKSLMNGEKNPLTVNEPYWNR